jgi:soluble lytic murein transglycosylase-like protein
MLKVKFAVFPGLVLGSLMIVLISNLIFPNENVLAENRDYLDNSSAPKSDFQSEKAITQDCQIGQNFPDKIIQWCNYIMSAGEKHQLDPKLIAAVMLQESGGNPDAYSKSGAVGLMQIMPRDGIASEFMCINGPCFASRPAMSELFDPAFNIDYGANMLAGLIERYGNERDALKAYGPMNMEFRYADLVLSIYYGY